MKIFYASGERPNQALPGSQVWRNNLYMALVDLGHEVIEFDYDLNPLLRHADIGRPDHRAFVEANRPLAEAALLDQVIAAHQQGPIDLFFSYFYSVCARPATIRQIGEMGIRTMNWYCNGSYQFDLVEEIAPAYDWSLVPESFRLDDYRRVGANPIYCQEAANPLIYHPRPIARDLDVVFVGARYGERPAYIRRLVDAGICVRVFGPGWRRPQQTVKTPARGAGRTEKSRWGQRALQLLTVTGWRRLARKVARGLHLPPPTARSTASAVTPATKPRRLDDEVALPPEVCGPPLSDDEMVEMYSRARISLGFSAVGNNLQGSERILQVRLRDFEAPMSGAFYLVEQMEELERFFRIGQEIVCYTGPDDLVEKCEYYLAHEEERERIRAAGYARALRDHTWQRRFNDVFQAAGLVPSNHRDDKAR
jgi:spore maturation protein CgeB